MESKEKAEKFSNILPKVTFFKNFDFQLEKVPGVARHVKNLTMPFIPDHNTPKELTGGYGEHADYMRNGYFLKLAFLYKLEQLYP